MRTKRIPGLLGVAGAGVCLGHVRSALRQLLTTKPLAPPHHLQPRLSIRHILRQLGKGRVLVEEWTMFWLLVRGVVMAGGLVGDGHHCTVCCMGLTARA